MAKLRVYPPSPLTIKSPDFPLDKEKLFKIILFGLNGAGITI